ncbi:hypothetical protein AeMF1_019428 [Aphanomyces euteiches]|nr:hypothetical protein AeMF1_019428 [Aphanomyces euteiches]KAH9194639.1 hypothetical protein AeNC1_003375 [Aphanomyces euteiches]
MVNMFTGETAEQATEKHNLKMDYASMLQEQIREQNEKKERAKLLKQEEQRREREEMDRLQGNNNTMHPSPEKQTKTKLVAVPEMPQHYSPVKPVVAPPPQEVEFKPPPTFTAPTFSPPASTYVRPLQMTSTSNDLDSIQKLRAELENARKQRLVEYQQTYERPNFMLPTSKSAPLVAPPRDVPKSLTKVELRNAKSLLRPRTPLDESNQLESTSSFVSVHGGEPVDVVDTHFEIPRLDSHLRMSNCQDIEDSLDDLDSILHTYLAKTKG